mmetsp:Transcript_1526/g.1647  ORF Transcript_1526/g.1647 Transcript_1526/m.1647 type:complete len:418 (+) Transcript_1526:58-1311(+)
MMQSIHNDEDWSIISSSSDMDDDQSTGSSALGSSKELSLDQDKEVSSVGTLKLPVISPDIETTNRIEATKSPKKPIVEPIIEDTSRNEDRHIDNVIRFYENLSFKTGKWNDSIKQKSSQFYQNVAKLRFEQFNKFISSKDSIDTASDKTSDNNDVNGGVGALDIVDIAEAQSDLKDDRNCEPNCSYLKLATLQDFMEENSEYLFYYFVSSILGVFSLLGLYYNVNWNSILGYQKQQPTPSVLTTTLSYFDKTAFKFRNYLEDLFYEDSYPTSKYFGLYQVAPSKTIKFSKKMNIWKEYDAARIIEYLNVTKDNGIVNFKAWCNYIIQNHSARLIHPWHNFKLRYVNIHDVISSEFYQIPGYIKLANKSLLESFDRCLKKNYMACILQKAKFNVDKSARYIYKSSYPLRKLVADSMNV